MARNYDRLKLAESEEMKNDRAYLEATAEALRATGVDVSTRLAAGDPPAEGARGRADLRVVPEPVSDLQAALEETVAAARKIRREIEERIASALDDLSRTRAPERA